MRTWCKTDPTVLVDRKPYGLTIGIDGDARGDISSIVVSLGFVEPIEVQGEGHKLLGVPIVFRIDSKESGLMLVINASNTYYCTIAFYPRDGEGQSWFGAGITGMLVEAARVEES